MSRARRGLAPLELVLSLFFFLLIMALIINFGTTAPWHVRGQIAARHAVWRTLAARTGALYPNPSNWWPPATMAVSGMPFGTATVGQVWSQGDLMQPALRGPVITSPATGKQITMNNRQYMEMTNQAAIGTAGLTKAMPLLPNMRNASIYPLQPVLDHYWRFQDMGFGDNGGRRVPGWYKIHPFEIGDADLTKLLLQYNMQDQQILQNSDSAKLLPLDRDEEFPPWGMASPDVYPTLAACDASPQSLQRNAIMNPRGLIDRIRGSPQMNVPSVSKNLARAFINLYNRQIAFYQSQQPPDQAQIQRLQNLIQQLQQVQ